MPSLFQVEGLAEMLRRLQALQPGTPAVWGKMDVAQMLAHCQVPLRVASGELRLPRSFLGRLLGGMVKKKVTGPEPFRRGLPTDARFRVEEPREFAHEQRELMGLLERLQKAGPGGLTREPHPFFGPMSAEEWDALLWKHMDHHLQQFGV